MDIGIVVGLALTLLALAFILFLALVFWNAYHAKVQPEERVLRRSAMLYCVTGVAFTLFMLEWIVVMLLRQLGIVPGRLPEAVTSWVTIVDLGLLTSAMAALLIGLTLDSRWRLRSRWQE